jgi:serine/threonine protein kinase
MITAPSPTNPLSRSGSRRADALPSGHLLDEYRVEVLGAGGFGLTRVMLIDFGAARAAVGRHSRNVTSPVTPGYSPPEQYTTRTDRYGTWTDLYALGTRMAGTIPCSIVERPLATAHRYGF